MVAVTDKAIEKLKVVISSSELRPGQRLPREPDLAASLGLSRSSLREAVRALSLVRSSTSATAMAPTSLTCLPNPSSTCSALSSSSSTTRQCSNCSKFAGSSNRQHAPARRPRSLKTRWWSSRKSSSS